MAYAPAASAAAPPRSSALRCAKNKVASHVAAVSSLLARHRDDVHVELADASLRALEAILHGGCVSSSEIDRLRVLSHDHSRHEEAGTRALVHLGGAIRSMSIVRNESHTLAHGLVPDEYGLPLISIKPPLDFGDSDEYTSPPSPQLWHSPHTSDPLYQETPIEESIDISYTSGVLRGVTGHVDISCLPPFNGEESDEEEKESNKETVLPKKKKKYSVNSRAPPFEYKCDKEGNVLVKSEMMGDDEFFDHQIQMRELGDRYEAIARTGEFEDRFIMQKILGRGSKTAKNYVCEECGQVFANQHKFAAHKRYTHPKNSEIRAAKTAERAMRMSAADADITAVISTVREKRERRAPIAFDQMNDNSMASPPLSTPTSTKIYTCSICEEILHSQHKFAAHMRYKHPKSSEYESMVGRRASVSKVVQKEPPSISSTPTTPIMTSSADKDTATKDMDSTPPALYELTVGIQEETPSREEDATNKNEETPKSYTCRVCDRVFHNHNVLAGHSRHCKKTNGTSTTKGETPVKKEKRSSVYTCRVCARTFKNANSFAGHTRHCMHANGVTPSPRSMKIREAKAAAATTPLSQVQKDSLATSPLAVSPTPIVMNEKKGDEMEERATNMRTPRKRPATAHIKEEEAEGDSAPQAPKKAAAIPVATTPEGTFKLPGLLTMATRSSSRSRDLVESASSPLSLPVLCAPSFVTLSTHNSTPTITPPILECEVKEEPNYGSDDAENMEETKD